MNQLHWTYWDDFGRRHIIGILHTIKSGHLVIHCNSKVIIIDFKVLKSKSYSFFIDEHLCKLKIEHKEGKFDYDLAVNENLNSQKNLKKREEQKKFFYQKIGSIFLAIFILTFITFLLYYFK